MYDDTQLGIFGIGRKLKKLAKKVDISKPLKKLAANLPITGDIIAAREAKDAAEKEAKGIKILTAAEEQALIGQQAQSDELKTRVFTLAGLVGIGGAIWFAMRKKR